MSEGPGQQGWGTPPGGEAPRGWGTPPGGQTPQGWGTPPGGSTPPAWGAPGGPPPGPLGPQQDWRQLPPEHLARLHQPGVVPLRPLYLGDVFGGALQTMRRNPEATIGMGFIVLAVLLIPSLLLSLALTQLATTVAEGDLVLLTTLITALSSALSSIALTGMIVHVVGQAVLGSRASLADTWRATRGRIPALIGTVAILTVLTVAFTVAAVFAVVLVVLALENAGNGVALAIVLVLLVLGLVVLGIWAGCRLSLAPGAVVLERAGPLRGLLRAWSLTRGRQGWRVVGITMLAALLTSIFTMVVQLPISFVALLVLDPTGLTYTPTSPLLLTIDHLGQLVIGALTIPFTAGVTALLYLDQRMRREGLDVTLLRTAQERAAARQDPPRP